MSEPIKIIITAETAQAANDLQKLVSQYGAGLSVIQKQAAATGEKLAGMSYYFRSSIDAIRFAAAGGGDRAVFYALDEGIRGLLSSGMALSRLVPILGGVGLALGAGALIWHEWNAGEEEAAKKAKELADAWKELPPLLEKIQKMQQAGLLSKAAAAEYQDYLKNPGKYFIDENGQVTTQKTHRGMIRPVLFDPNSEQPPEAPYEGDIDNQPATPELVQKYLEKDTPVGQVQDNQLKGFAALDQDARKASESAMPELDRKIAEVEDREKEAAAKILQDAALTQVQLTDIALAGTARVKEAKEALANNEKGAEMEIAALKQKNAEAEARSDQEINYSVYQMLAEQEALEKSIAAQEKKISEEKMRQVAAQRELERAQTESQLKFVQGNPLLTDTEKANQSVPLISQLMGQNYSALAQYQNQAATDPNGDARIAAQQKVNELMGQQVQLGQQLKAAQGENSYTYQLAQAVTHLRDMNNLAKEVAQTFANVFNTSISTVSHNLTGVIMGTETWRRALRNIYTTIMTDIINSIIQMGVRYVATTLMMDVFGKALRTEELAAELAATTIEAKALNKILVAPAALQAIATDGAALAAAIPVFALAGFDEGGYTGPGARTDMAGIVHAGEYVFSAPAVQRIGIPALEAMHRDAGAGTVSAGGGAGGDVKIDHVVVYNDQQLYNKLKSSTAKKIFVTHLTDPGVKTRIGLQT